MYTESFAFYLAVLRRHFVAYCTEKLGEAGITYGQLFILIYISKKRECAPKEISENLKLDAGQLNRTLGKLSEKNMIIQRKNDRDRRANIVSLTEKGKKAVEDSKKLFSAWDDQILSGMDADSRHKLIGSMRTLVLGLENNYGGKNNERIQ